MKGLLIRWGLMALGVFLIHDGIQGVRRLDPMDEEAKAVDVQQCIKLLEKQETCFIKLKANLQKQRIYFSGLKTPRYARCPGGQFVSFLGADGIPEKDWFSHLGCNVKAESILNPIQVITIQTLESQPGESTQKLKAEKLLAPLLLGKGKLWVLSPTFWPGNDAKKTAWLTRKVFDGRLSRFNHLRENRTAMLKTVSEIRQFASREMKLMIPSDAMIIFTEHDTKFDKPYKARDDYFVGVAESDNHFFVRTTSKEEPSFDGGEIVGMMKPAPGANFGQFGWILKQKIPQRIGIITGETAADINEREKKLTSMGIKVGAFLLLLGMGLEGLWWFKRRMM